MRRHREEPEPTPASAQGEAPRSGSLGWRWALLSGAAFAGVFVGPSVGLPALETASVLVLIACVLYAMGLTGRRRSR